MQALKRWITLILVAVGLPAVLLGGAEIAARSLLSPRFLPTFVPLANTGLYAFSAQLPWAKEAPDQRGKPALPPKDPKEIRIAWVGESAIEGYPVVRNWAPMRLLDFILKRQGFNHVTQINVAQSGGITTDLEFLLDAMGDQKIDLFIFYFGINDNRGDRLGPRKLRILSRPLYRFRRFLLEKSSLARWVSQNSIKISRLPLDEYLSHAPARDSRAFKTQRRYFALTVQGMLDKALSLSKRVLVLPFIGNQEWPDITKHDRFNAIELGNFRSFCSLLARQQDKEALHLALGFSNSDLKALAADHAKGLGNQRIARTLTQALPISRDTVWLNIAKQEWQASLRGRKDVLYADMTQELIARSPRQIPGWATHFDFSHLNLLGQYILISKVYQVLREQLIPTLPKQIPPYDRIATEYARTLEWKMAIQTIGAGPGTSGPGLFFFKSLDEIFGHSNPLLSLVVAIQYADLGLDREAISYVRHAQEVAHGQNLKVLWSKLQNLTESHLENSSLFRLIRHQLLAENPL